MGNGWRHEHKNSSQLVDSSDPGRSSRSRGQEEPLLPSTMLGWRAAWPMKEKLFCFGDFSGICLQIGTRFLLLSSRLVKIRLVSLWVEKVQHFNTIQPLSSSFEASLELFDLISPVGFVFSLRGRERNKLSPGRESRGELWETRQMKSNPTKLEAWIIIIGGLSSGGGAGGWKRDVLELQTIEVMSDGAWLPQEASFPLLSTSYLKRQAPRLTFTPQTRLIRSRRSPEPQPASAAPLGLSGGEYRTPPCWGKHLLLPAFLGQDHMQHMFKLGGNQGFEEPSVNQSTLRWSEDIVLPRWGWGGPGPKHGEGNGGLGSHNLIFIHNARAFQVREGEQQTPTGRP